MLPAWLAARKPQNAKPTTSKRLPTRETSKGISGNRHRVDANRAKKNDDGDDERGAALSELLTAGEPGRRVDAIAGARSRRVGIARSLGALMERCWKDSTDTTSRKMESENFIDDQQQGLLEAWQVG